MPFSMPNFPILTPEQANPFHGALQTALKNMSGMGDIYSQMIKNKYLGPMSEQELQKAVLGNKFTQANITGKDIENKYAPLETAIKAQNSINYGNRTNNIGMFLRGISQMPAAERQAYLSNPANRSNYMSMLEQFRQGTNNPNNSNIITPDYIRSFGLGGQVPPQSENSSQQPMSPQTQQPSQQTAPQLQQPEQQMASEQQPSSPQQQAIQNAPRNAEGTDVTALPSVTPDERQLLSSQLMTNNQKIGNQLKNRADAAIAFDKFLQLHRPQIETTFKDAVRYNQLYGRGKNWMEKFKQNQPEEYANYITAKNSLTPLMSNGIRFLEAMGISHEAQEDARNQVSQAVDRMDVSPETALKVFNNHMRALSDVSQGILDSAEPAYPGVRKRLAGLKEFPKEFISMQEKPSAAAKSLSKDLKLPKFNNKKEFKEWYRRQPKMVQDAVQLNLRGK